MTVFIHNWERSLFSLAHQPYEIEPPASTVSADKEQLEAAYAHCDALTSYHSRSFYMASALLPREKRQAVRALYAFCRVTDDIVDEPSSDPVQELAQWRQDAMADVPPDDNLVALAWTNTRHAYHIPAHYAHQLLDGVARDTVQNRYKTIEDLAAYSYGVASTVGLMSMHIIGFDASKATPYAIKLGVALQLTNILRDVGEDWRSGRLYLPQEELEAFGLSEERIAESMETGHISAEWRSFMRFQIERNRQLYEEAWPGIGMLNKDGRFAIGAAAGLYRGILNDIEAHDYDVFTRRAHIGKWGKLRRLPSIWYRTRAHAFPSPNSFEIEHHLY